jgi:hypothetical protein
MAHRWGAFCMSNKKLPLLLILALSMALLIGGTCMFLAGVANYQAEAFMDAWAQVTKEPDERGWQIARNAAQRAAALYPTPNGAYLDSLGRVYGWQQFRHVYGDPAASVSRHAALAAYRASVAVRPTWPYTWGRLAHIKFFLQEYDGEFDQAFAQTLLLGPTRIEVSRELADIGFGAWMRLNKVQRQVTREAAVRGVAYGSRESTYMLMAALRAGQMRELCRSLSAELKTKRHLCLSEKYSLTSPSMWRVNQ